MLNGKLENSFISGQDKETLRRTRTERQNYEEISKEFRERIVKDLDTKELKALNQKSGASLLSIQAMMKVQGSYLRNIDNSLKKLVKINDNFIKALTKNMSLGTKINLGSKAARLGSYASDNRSNVLRENKDYTTLSKNISTFTDVIKELDKRQNERTNEVLSMLSEVPTDLSTNISMAIDKTLRDHPTLRKIYGTLSATAGSAFNWTRQGISEMLGLPGNFSLGNLTKIVSWNTTGKWEHEVKINKSLPLQTIISLLSSIQKQTWLINNDALYNIQNGRKNANRELEDKGGLKKFADSLAPGFKKGLLAYLGLKGLTNGWLPFLKLDNLAFWLGKTIISPIAGFFGNIGVGFLSLIGKGLINYPKFGSLTLGGLVTAGTLLFNRARTNARRMVDNEKKQQKMISEAQGNWYNPEYQTIRTRDGKNLAEKDRSKSWFGYVKEEFSKSIGHSILTEGLGKTISNAWLSIFNQDKLRAEREANDKEAEAIAVENFKNKFIISIAKRGKDVVDAIIGLKEMEYNVQLVREQVVGKSNFHEIEQAKRNLAEVKAQQKFAEEAKIDPSLLGFLLQGQTYKDAWNWTGNKIKNIWPGAKNGVTNIWGNVSSPLWWLSQVSKTGDFFKNNFSKQGIKDNAGKAWEGIKGGASWLFKDSSLSKLVQDWYSEATKGRDDYAGILQMLQNGGIQSAENILDSAKKDKNDPSSSMAGRIEDAIFTVYDDMVKTFPTKLYLSGNDKDSFTYKLFGRIGFHKGKSNIEIKLNDINNQFYYGKKNANSFASVLFGKIDNINKYLWEVIGTDKDKNDETKLYGIIRQIFTEVGQLKPQPRGHTLKYILNGALSPDLEKVPGNIKYTQDILEGIAKVFGISQSSGTNQASGTIQYQGPQPANQNLLNAAKGKGKGGKGKNNNQNIQNSLTRPFTNQTSQNSIFYLLGEDVHKILEILNDNMSNKKNKKSVSVWDDPAYYFAEGGEVHKPVHAVIGEAGPEGVFPLTKEVFQNFAKAIVSEMKGLEGSEYDIARKKGLPVLGAIIEAALQTGVKTSLGLTKALSKDGYNFIKDLPSNMVNLTETVDAYDQEWTGKAQNFLGKTKEKFDVLDTFTDKLLKGINEKVMPKLYDNIDEKIEDFNKVTLGEKLDKIIDTNIQSISGNIKWSTAHLIHWVEESSKGKTYVGKKIIGFTNYLKEDLETFKKRWKNTYGPILANPLKLLLGDNMKPITQVLGRMITPVLGGILAWYFMSPEVRRMVTGFFQDIIPNIMKDGFWGGLRNTIADAISKGPSYNEAMYDPEHKVQGLAAVGIKQYGSRALAGKVVATGAKATGLVGKAAKGVGAVAYGTGKVATTVVKHTPIVSEAAKATMSKYFKTQSAKIVAKSNTIARGAKALATGAGKKIAGGVIGLGTTFAIDGAQLALSLKQLENAQTPEEMDAALREIAINQDRLKWDAAGAGAGGTIGGIVGSLAGGVGAVPGAVKGADIGSTITSIGFDVYNWATDAKSYKLSDDDFLKEKASIYGIKDISSMDAKQKKLLRALILQIECKPATDKMTPVQLESLKYDIAALANSNYIVKATKDGKFKLDTSFTKDFYKSNEFKDISKAFEQFKERKQIKRVGAGHVTNGGKYKSFLSNDIFKGDVSQELEKMILWLKNEYPQIYLRCFEELPDQRKAIYLNLWMDWRYPKEGQKFIPERGLTIAESIKREGQEINRKNKLGEVKAMAPNIKLALRNLDNRDGADTHKMTIKMKKNRNLNIFGNTSKPNSNTDSSSTVVGGVIGGSQVSSGSAPTMPAMPKSPNSIAEKLATAAQNVAWSMGKYKSQSKCARGVKRALVDAGILKEYPWGDNVDEAWKMADYFTKTGKFYEITSKFNNKEDIVQAPRGSIIVWGKSPTKKYGHIEVALGNGKTASDFLWNVNSLFESEKKNNKYYGPARIFYPIGEGDNIAQETEESSGGLYNGIKNFFSGVGNTITNSQAFKTVSDKLGEAKEIAEEKYNTYVPKSARDTISSVLTSAGNTVTDVKKFYNESINPSMKRAADAAWAETRSAKNWGNEYRQFSRWNPTNLFSSGESLDQDSLGQIQGDVQAVYDQWSKKYGYYNDSKEAKESWERQISKLGPGQKAFAEMYFQKLSENANPIMAKYNEMKAKFEDVTNKTIEVATEAGNQLLEKSNEIAAKAKDEAKKSSDEVVSELKEIKEVLVEKSQAAGQAIINNVNNVKNSSEYKTISNAVNNTIDSMANGVNDMASGTMNLIDNLNY